MLTMTELADFSHWGYVRCPWCHVRVYGTPNDIDSGLRKHCDYCELRPEDEE